MQRSADSRGVKSSMPSRSARGLRKRKIERFPGTGEGDLLSGAKNSYIATLVERHSRFAMLVKVPGKDTQAVVRALSRQSFSGTQPIDSPTRESSKGRCSASILDDGEYDKHLTPA